jgi:CDP-glycerol glycerophosphotransferase (TagB/SpsB family)
MEALEHDTTAWVYGQKMIDFLKEKKVFNHLDVTVLGNFRYAYYQKHRAFYDRLVSQAIPTTKKVILYAPTWKDAENSSSFDEAFPILTKNLPPEYALVIKPHPNFSVVEAPQPPGVFFLRDFPPIYPLLNRTVIYIGDMSSIGYDFLTFNRPMVFLNPNRRDPKNDPGLFLHRCGITVNPENYDKIYDLLDDQAQLSLVRKEVYEYTFGNVKQIDICG